MENQLEKLIVNLYIITKDNTLNIRHDGHYYINQPIISDTIALASECLIDTNGSINSYNVDILKSGGISIYIGDLDNYGYLTGIIDLPDGTIMFG